MKRHLIYHCCPLKTNDGWRENFAKLGPHLQLFDGERRIAIAQGEGCHDCETVEYELSKYVEPCTLKLMYLPNDQRLREVATFLYLLDAVQQECDDAVFYAHTKGNSTIDDKHGGLGVTRWRNAMYANLLDAPVWSQLTNYDAIGTTAITWNSRDRRRGACRSCPFPSKLQVLHCWMFAGTFFWFSARVFAQYDWRAAIKPDRYGAEGWLGNMMPRERALSVYQPRPEWTAWNPYDPNCYEERYSD